MGKRGPSPQPVDTTWTPELAYVVGVFASDGNLGKDGLYLDVTSKDKEILETVLAVLKLTHIKIGTKSSGQGNSSYRIQFKRKIFHQWLVSIGLMPNKSRRIRKLHIHEELFFDFLRGYWDGDGTVTRQRDKRWKNSYIDSIGLASGSLAFLRWMQKEINSRLGTTGFISEGTRVLQLRYARGDSRKILQAMFYRKGLPHLERKLAKAKKIFRITEL